MKKKNNTALYLSLTILALIWLVPIVTVFITSLKSNSDFFSGMGLFDLPEKLQWHNYSDAWSKGHLDRYIRNGLIVTCLKVPISVFISSLLAFALTRLHVRHARGIFIFVLIGMMLPQQAALIPLNIVYSRAGLTNTYYCLILTYLGFGIPLATLVFRGFFRSIPKELDDAARIDGCGTFGVFTRIVLPLSKPIIVVVAIFAITAAWSDFLMPFLLLSGTDKETIMVKLYSFQTSIKTNQIDIIRAVLYSIIPPTILFAVFQKQIMGGVMSGGIKG